MNNAYKTRDFLLSHIDDYRYGKISAPDFCSESARFILLHPLYHSDADLQRALDILKGQINRFCADKNETQQEGDLAFWIALKDIEYLLKYERTFTEEREDYFQNGIERTDPVEYTDAYLAIEPEAERLIRELTGEGEYLGFCHTYWATKKRVLKEEYGIDWQSPSDRHPGMLFD